MSDILSCLPAPADRERDGWHWLENIFLVPREPHPPIRQPAFWNAYSKVWNANGQPIAEGHWHYVGPVPTPEEIAALKERIEQMDRDGQAFALQCANEHIALREELDRLRATGNRLAAFAQATVDHSHGNGGSTFCSAHDLRELDAAQMEWRRASTPSSGEEG